MTKRRTQIALAAIAAMLLSACATIKMPNIDVPGIPEFKEAAAKLVDGYPEASEAPVRPKDLRSSKEWDAAANSLLTEREAFVVPELGGLPETPEAITEDVEALKAQVRSYKLDDPQ